MTESGESKRVEREALVRRAFSRLSGPMPDLTDAVVRGHSVCSLQPDHFLLSLSLALADGREIVVVVSGWAAHWHYGSDINNILSPPKPESEVRRLSDPIYHPTRRCPHCGGRLIWDGDRGYDCENGWYGEVGEPPTVLLERELAKARKAGG